MSRLRSIKYMDYADHYEELSAKLLEWQEMKPDNKEIARMITNLCKIAFHMADLNMEIEDLGAQMREYRHQKNLAIEKLREEMHNKANRGIEKSI